MSRRLQYAISIFCLAVLLTACASSPPVRYFSLEPSALNYSGDEQGGILVGLGPLRMPDYLKRPQISTRISGTEVMVDEFARWAEPADQAVHRVVAANVDAELQGVVAVAYPYIDSVDLDYWVLGRIDRFNSDASGSVLLLVQWAVFDKQRQPVVAPRRARYEAAVASPGSPDAIVVAMNEALTLFSKDLAAALKEILPPTKP